MAFHSESEQPKLNTGPLPELSVTSEASRAAARSISAIAFNQVAQVTGSVLFVALVPRILGAVVYGELAFAFALITILQMLGELGYQEVFSRFLPEVRQHHGRAGMQAMIVGLFKVRGVVGLVLGLAAAVVARLAGDWLSPVQAALIGLAVLARVWSMGPFPLLLGLGETHKWSVETTWRQITVTCLVLLLVRSPSLTMALLAMALHEVVFLVLGLYWVREWLVGKADGRGPAAASRAPAEAALPAAEGAAPTNQLSVAGYLKFGFVFSLANYALVVLFRISPIMVEKLTGSHAETGYFDLALGGLLLLYTLLGQVAYAFVPILTPLHLAQRQADVDLWLGRVVRYSAMLMALAMGGMWALARPMAPVLFGTGFAPAYVAIHMMAFSLLPLPIAWAGVMLAAVDKQPRRKLWAALLGLAAFLVAAVALQGFASAGIALAFGLAMGGYAVGFGASAMRAVRAGGWGWLLATGGTLLFLPLLWSQFDTPLSGVLAWAGLALLYTALIVAARAARFEEVQPLMRAVLRRGR